MNAEEVKLRGPSLPLDVHWGHFAYSRFLERHPSYRVTEGHFDFCNRSFSAVFNRYPFVCFYSEARVAFATNRGLQSGDETKSVRRVE